MSALIPDITRIRSQLTEEVLSYLNQVAARAAEVPTYYPAHLRSLERGKTRFDEIRQTVQVVQDREVFQKSMADQRERQRAAGYPTDSPAYSSRSFQPDRAGEEFRTAPIPWDEHAGERFRRAVILGDPGLGKTWLLRYEARRIARASAALLEDSAVRLEEAEFPIFLRLSDVNRTKGTIEDALISLVGEGRSESFRGLVRRKLESNTAVLLLDAWDEVGEREELRQRLESFAGRRPEMRMLVTSRIVGYEMSPLPEAEEVELSAWRRTEIEAFVEVWFADRPEHGNAFLQMLDQNYGVAGLAEIPLMLALMCRSWRGEANGFPQRRGELYGRCLTGLLRDWKQTKGKKAEDVVLEAVGKKLTRAAEHLFRAGKEQFTEGELARALGYAFEEEGEAIRAQRFIDERKAEGIFTAANAEGTQLLFLHRTFQEYLTARALSERGWEAIAGLIDKKAWLPGWREVVVLLAGQMADAGPLLDLLADESKDDYFRHRLVVAAHCLPEISEGRRDHRVNGVTAEFCRKYQSIPGGPETTHLREALVPLVRARGLVDGIGVVRWLMAGYRADGQYFMGDLQKIAPLVVQPEILDEILGWLREGSETLAYGACQMLDAMGPRAYRSDLARCLVAAADRTAGRFNPLWTLKALCSGRTNEEMLALLRQRRAVAEERGDSVAYERLTDALESLGDQDLLDKLLEDLHSEVLHIRVSSIQRLENAGSVAARDDILAELLKLVKSESADLRFAAAKALGYMGRGVLRREIVEQISTLLNDGDDRVLISAAGALANLTSAPPSPAVIRALQPLLRHANGAVRRAVISALQDMGAGTPYLLDEILRLLRDEDNLSSTLFWLGRFGSRAARSNIVDELVRLWRQGNEHRGRILPVLGNMGLGAARAEIVEDVKEIIRNQRPAPYNVLLHLVRLSPAAARGEIIELVLQHIDDEDRKARLPFQFGLMELQRIGTRVFRDGSGKWTAASVEQLARQS